MNAVAPWRLALLGVPALTTGDGRDVRCEGKTLALLTYLALEGPTGRSRLAGLLWPEHPEATARNNLVHVLRRLERACGAPLVHGHDRLALASNGLVDAAPLLQAASAPHPDVPDGPLLQDRRFPDSPEFEEWLEVQRERLDTLRARLLTHAAQQLEDAGQYADALIVTRRLLALDAASEDAHRRRMRLHYLTGDIDAALAAYDACVRALRDELHTEPLAETHALARDIERGALLPRVLPPRPHVPASVLRPAVLVGRARAWSQLENAWAAGQLIFVAGDAGIGKSRLIHDFAASKGAVLSLECRPGDEYAAFTATARNIRKILHRNTNLTLDPWVREALTPLLPELGSPGGMRAQLDARLLDAVSTVFSAGLSDVSTLIVDDLQYGDLATIEAGFMLFGSAFPLGGPSGIPHVISAYRRGELTAEADAFVQRQVAAGKAVLIEIEALDAHGVQALVADLGIPALTDVAARLARFTHGNPQFLLETVKHLIETNALASIGEVERLPLPPKVNEILRRRLARVSVGALQAARAAAVVQADFSLELIARMLNAPLLTLAAAWDELEAAQIMQGDRFTHDLVYEAVAAGIPGAVRKTLHRSAARVLNEDGAPPARVARQWLNGGAADRAVPLLLEGVRDALATSRWREADELYALVEAAYEATGDQRGAEQIRHARAELMQQRPPEAASAP